MLSAVFSLVLDMLWAICALERAWPLLWSIGHMVWLCKLGTNGPNAGRFRDLHLEDHLGKLATRPLQARMERVRITHL